jgi:large subunit ribosomal protein L15
MRLDDIRPQEGATRLRRRLARGHSAGQGKTAGRGMRGQKCRSGGGVRPGFEGGQIPLYRRLPKLKGFTPPNQITYTEINVESLNSFKKGEEVSLEILLAKKILTDSCGPLKVLGRGELTVSVNVKAAGLTGGAKAKIEAAGGSWTVER